MIKIAIFSDVHGNLPALKTVLKDIKEKGIQYQFCLGDLVDFAPWCNEVIEIIRQENILCLLGNHDERIAFDQTLIPLEKHSEAETNARNQAINHTRKAISEENKNYLSQLPFNAKLNYKVGKKHWKIQLVHASLNSNDTYIYESENDNTFRKLANEADADIVVMGHTHISFKKKIDDLWFVNCGSVGRSKEENRLASYLSINLFEDKIIPEIVQIPYPIEETIEAIENSEIPNFYSEFLRNKKS
ncbi:metallophosphoesterase family protein [Soonwooa sp.]|uniref:metallophosphoesterase family protein n=1 Tax=Soonwooa sp. TaxID=1938592 RepID=UPI00261A668A|nr:metallophosphoesterase family protein [Soonwooa sp.]